MQKIIKAKSHADFLNQAFGTNYRAFLKSRFPYGDDTWVWMIRIDGKVHSGWRNIKISENEVWEEYVGDGEPTYTKTKERAYRIVVEIVDAPAGRNYLILGKYKFDFENSSTRKHVLRKIEE